MLFPKSLIKRLIFLFLLVVLSTNIMGFPAIVGVSFSSRLLDMFGKQVNAQEGTLALTSTENSQTMALLIAPSALSQGHKIGVESIATIGGVALLAEARPAGSLVGVDGVSSSVDQISIYIVHGGDTLGSIAKMFDVSKNTILWANDIKGGRVSVGDRLVILPISGIRRVVQKGDTISSIAKKYKASKEEIAQFNDVPVDSVLDIGDVVIVPDGVLDNGSNKEKNYKKNGVTDTLQGKNLDNYFTRPILGGRKTQGIHGHNGVDLASAFGTPVMAAASGTVIVSKTSGYNGGYGNFIVINHPNGTQTLYAHLSANLVSDGVSVVQGEVIAQMGDTGNSTGNHVHFEIHGARNPF